MKALRGPLSGFITGLVISAGLAVVALQPTAGARAGAAHLTISTSPLFFDSSASTSGSGFKPGEVVLLRENGMLVAAPIANSAGKFSIVLTIPSSAAGHTTVVFSAYGSASKLSVSVTVPVMTLPFGTR